MHGHVVVYELRRNRRVLQKEPAYESSNDNKNGVNVNSSKYNRSAHPLPLLPLKLRVELPKYESIDAEMKVSRELAVHFDREGERGKINRPIALVNSVPRFQRIPNCSLPLQIEYILDFVEDGDVAAVLVVFVSHFLRPLGGRVSG